MKYYIVILSTLFLFVTGCKKEQSQNTVLDGDKKTTEQIIKTSPGSNTTEDITDLKKDMKKESSVNLKQLEKNTSINENINTENAPQIKRLVIKTGTMSVEVENFEDAEKKVQEIAVKQGGYIATSNSNLTASGKKQGSITVKVPADKFDILTSELSVIGKVAAKNISTSDVTEEYVDLEARVKTQKELEQRLLKLLQEKSARLSDLIEVEYKLADVRRQIESIEGKIRVLLNKADFSTLTVTIYEPSLLQTSSGGGFFYEIGQAIKDGLKGFTNVLVVIISVLIAFIPLFVLGWIIFIIVRRIIRKKQEKREAVKTSS
jgi:hypothetical protein